MKKKVLAVLMVGVLLGMGGCEKKENTTPVSEKEQETTETETTETDETVTEEVEEGAVIDEDIDPDLIESATIGEDIEYEVDANQFAESIESDLEIGSIKFGNYTVKFPVLDGFTTDEEAYDDGDYLMLTFENENIDCQDVILYNWSDIGATAASNLENDPTYDGCEKKTKVVDGVTFHYASSIEQEEDYVDSNWTITCDLPDGWVFIIHVSVLGAEEEVPYEVIEDLFKIALVEN